MAERVDNYKIQAQQAKKLFLTYDQQELILRCRLRFDDAFFYTKFLGEAYRICRKTGDMERLCNGVWVDGNGFGEVMTILDWLCDSRADRYITGRWVNIVTQNHSFHGTLQKSIRDPDAELFEKDPDGFRAACRALGGEALPGGDIGYAIELIDGLRVLLQLWYSDEDFPAQLRIFWDENVLRYIRYETSWFAVGVLLQRLREKMENGR